MRTAFELRAAAIAAACLVGLAASGLAGIEQASAQYNGNVTYTSGDEAVVPVADMATVQSATPGTCAGGACAAGACSSSPGAACNACQASANDECPACSGRGCPHCNGTGIFRGCGPCRAELRRGHRGLLGHHGYWDGRRECEDAPYGKDDSGRLCEPRWGATIGSIIMSRSTARKAVIIEQNSVPLVTIDDLDLEWSAGPRVDVIRRFDAFDVEFIYWGIDNWDDGAMVVSNNRDLTSDVNGFTNVYTAAGVRYQSRLYNGESNLKLRAAEAVNLILGGRVMELHEKFFFGAGENSGNTLDATADNYLYGFQVGADTDVPIWAGISFNLFIKGGCFVNHINQRWQTAQVPAVIGGFTSGNVENDEVAFVGETGVIGTWQVNKNLGLYGGYQFMWLDGVILAADMATGVPVRTNTPHYEGAMFGLTLQW